MAQEQTVHILTGPPADPGKWEDMAAQFFQQQGKHVLCGGTTATLAAAYLGKELRPQLQSPDPEIPPTATLEGVELVTEGALTLARVLQYVSEYEQHGICKQMPWESGGDGASLLMKLLLEAAEIRFYVGTAANPAKAGTLPDRGKTVTALASCLGRLGKRVGIEWY